MKQLQQSRYVVCERVCICNPRRVTAGIYDLQRSWAILEGHKAGIEKGLDFYQDCGFSVDDRVAVRSFPFLDPNSHMIVARPLEERFKVSDIWRGAIA